MKLEKFKQILKETVKEAVKEAISESLSEGKSTINNKIKNNLMESINVETPQVNISSNPIMDILEITKKSMNNSDYQTMANFNSSDVMESFNPGVGVNTTAEGSSLPPGEVNMDQIMGLLNGGK